MPNTAKYAVAIGFGFPNWSQPLPKKKVENCA